MNEELTATQVADRLGVALPTVYAYASRGSLTRRPGPGGRASRYDADEVEVLAQRARPRSSRRRPGAIDVVIGTTVSEIGDGWIRYRDHDLMALVERRFEDVAHLLWTGDLPEPSPAGSWPDLDNTPLRQMVAADATRVARALPVASSNLARLAVGAAAASCSLADEVIDPSAAGAVLVDALVASLDVIGRTDPGPRASVAARLWARVSPLAPTAPRVRVLDRALVLLAEHELATSTLAVRVAASTGAGPAEAVLAGLGAVCGPLHGQAPGTVHRRLLTASAAAPVQPSGDDRPHAEGFGHVVHQRGDPRFPLLEDRVVALASPSAQRVIEGDLAAHAAAGTPPPNVDAALGALAYVARCPPGSTEAIFAIARTAGWLAHAFEEADERPLRFRGRTIHRSPH
jgi:citrate synthase